MKHLFLLQVSAIPFYIKEVLEDKLVGYSPDPEGRMISIEVPRKSLPIDDDMIEEIREILN